MEGETTSGVGTKARTGAVGTLIVAYWLLDGIVIGIPVVVLAAWLNPLVVWIVAAALLVPLNIWFSRWLDGHWDGWFAGNAGRVEKKPEKMRKSSLMKHPVAWIQRGAGLWYALAAAVTSAITVTAFARVIGGQPLGDRRVVLAGVGYGLFCSGIWVLMGFLLSDVIRAA